MLPDFRGLALILAFLAPAATAHGQDYKPGFPCPRSDDSDQLASAICADPAMAKAELILEKAYYLHREVDGPAAYPELKAHAAALDTATRQACKIPTAGKGGPLPPAAASCYIAKTQQQASEWNQWIYGPPYAEAIRDIDTHIALQKKLAADGYMPGAIPDGVYGDGTREAIIAWQRSRSLQATGFLSDLQGRQLLASAPPRDIQPAQEADDKLQAVFTRDMLDIRVPYLERITGPAMRIRPLSGGRVALIYRVAGCNVTAYTSPQGDVYGYGVDLSRACKPDITDLSGQAPGETWPSTFNAYFQSLGGAYQSTCLSSCGNSSVPLLLFRHIGPHSADWINVEVTAPIDSHRSIDGASVWRAAMKPRGEDYVIDGRFNCDEGYQAVAQKALADLHVTHLFIGRDQDEVADEIDGDCKKQ